jgi:hypothetical protein
MSSPKFPTTVPPIFHPGLPFISPISISCLPLPDFTISSFKLGKNSSFMDTTGEKEKRTSKKNVDGRSTSSHDNKKFRTRSIEKQRNGIWFPEDSDSCYKTG